MTTRPDHEAATDRRPATNRRRLSRRFATVSVLAAIVLVSGTAVVVDWPGDGPPRTRVGPVHAVPAGGQANGMAVESAIRNAQLRLRVVPEDWSTWAGLGSAYVQQARITADASYYPKAEGALRRSLELENTTNWQAMAGMGALANARHDFRAGLEWGRRAEGVNPYSGTVHGVVVDALTQLGDYPGARVSLQRMLDVDPGLASFARASYDFEQRGDVARARAALTRALADAASVTDIAFCRYHLGELAFANGDPAEALRQYTAGTRADPRYQPPFAGRAKAQAALGQTADALAGYERVTRAFPLPELLAQYGDLLAAVGRPDQARQQYALFQQVRGLSAGNGVVDHLESAVFLADHGDPVGALAEARAEWAVRPNVLAADALAWALHRNGRDAEALRHAQTATGLGWRNATFYYHRGVIRHSLGDDDHARRDLSTALRINPHFDVLQAPLARRLLDSLGGLA